MKEPKHTAEWQSLLIAAADKFVTNHKDGEVRRMYGYHFRSFVNGAVWEFERNADNFEKMKEAIIKANDKLAYLYGYNLGKDAVSDVPNILNEIEQLLESIK